MPGLHYRKIKERMGKRMLIIFRKRGINLLVNVFQDSKKTNFHKTLQKVRHYSSLKMFCHQEISFKYVCQLRK